VPPFDPFSFIAMLDLLLFGSLIILVAWVPMLVRRTPLTLAIVCVGLGAGWFAMHPEFSAAALEQPHMAEHLATITILVALMGAGLKIDRSFSFSGWRTTWRLIVIGMPLTIGCVLLLNIFIGGFAIPAALLMAAALSPTDPVLASEVSVGPPQAGDRGEIRFGLTSEAAVNDGMAFPFVQLAIVLTSAPFSGVWLNWILIDLLVKSLGGIICGGIIGWLAGLATFKLPRWPFSDTGDGLIALGLTLVAYAVADLVQVNGFLAVFVMAIVLRRSSPKDEFHGAMATFAEQIERLIAMLLLVFFGAALSLGMLDALGWRDVLIALLLLLIVRPAIGWLSLLGSPHDRVTRALIAFFGIRGIGTLYYMLYAFQEARFADQQRLWALGGFVVLVSVVLHGVTAGPLLTWSDRLARSRRQMLERHSARDAAPDHIE